MLFLTRSRGMIVFFTDTEAVMVLHKSEKRREVVRMKLAGAMKPRQAAGLEKLPGVSNYFIGNDPKKWRTDVPHYARIQYEGVYPGIDLVWYGNQRQLEYDFVVAAGADPRQIQVAYEGVESVGVEAGGELVLRTALGAVRQPPPRVYQEMGGKRVEVGARYAMMARNRVSFELASYDRKRELRIDPVVLAYSTYLGGSGDDVSGGIAVDAAGSAYVTGYTASTNFPSQSPYQATLQGTANVFVTKLSPAGNALVYSTYLGGSGWDWGRGIAVDGAGSAYVTGSTDSANFPTQSAYQATFQGGPCDAFVTKLSPAGNALVYSTYLGGRGQDLGFGIAVDGAGSAYVTGYTDSANFPTQSAYQATKQGDYNNAFVTKLTPAGNALVYSTYLGGSGVDGGSAIAVDGAGSAYVTGGTTSPDFPTQSPYQATFQGYSDAFVTKLTPAGNALVYSTYLGGSGDDGGGGIAVDGAGSAYVTGYTSSTNFPTQSAYQATLQGSQDAFVTKLTPAGNALSYSTYLGGSGDDWGFGIAVDAAGSAYVTGWTSSQNFPTQSPYQATNQGGIYDAFVTKLTPAGTALVYSTYLGGSGYDWRSGIALDGAGLVYVTGVTSSTNFPTQSPYQATFQGGLSDAFVTKLQLPATLAINGVVDSASGRPTIAPNSFVSIYGSGFTSWTGDWTGAIQNGMLPTTLGGVEVRIDGKACFVNYVSPSQLNVLTPFDTASGSVSVEVITAQGTATATAVMAPVAPALFGYTVAGRFYAVAQIANTTIIVAPAGTFGSAPSRPAQAGDYLTLWALGMGSTNPAPPAGQVLQTAYPISDLSRVKVRFGSLDAPVSWAGLVMAGLFQVNVLVPPGLSGDEPVVMTVDGQSTQANAFLNFQ
ncbi:MAG: SBBP repeat-containing protein [Bryobacteraceae bacterium]